MLKRKTSKKKLTKKRKNPIVSTTSVIEFFEIEKPRKIPDNPIDAYDLGTALGVLRGLELCNDVLAEDIDLFVRKQFDKTLDQLKRGEVFGPNEIKNTNKVFEIGIIVGLASASEKYCKMPKKQLQEFIQIARFKLKSLSHYL